LDTLNFYPLFGVLKKILSRYIQPLLSKLGKQGLKFCFVNKLKYAEFFCIFFILYTLSFLIFRYVL
ncbi:MAG TPA: hypothetical protein GXX15_00795, partial [Clostridia bacterium]|nr:hypothetical protein [Clostridia bacterium]